MKISHRLLYSVITISIIALGIFSLGIAFLEATDILYYECVDKVVVKEIAAVKYRTAYVNLTDGRMNVPLVQPIIKPGSVICLKTEERIKGLD